MSAVPPNDSESVSVLQAALLARVNPTSLYKIRTKLGAFQQDGVWQVPVDNLQKYIAAREARAREVLTPFELRQQ